MVAAFVAGTFLPILTDEQTGRAAQGGPTPYVGSLLYPGPGGIWKLDLPTQQRGLHIQVGSAQVTHVTHSVDRQRLAYSVNRLSASAQLSESEIVVADLDGGSARVVAREEGSVASLNSPTWSRDGRTIAYTITYRSDGRQRVEEVEVATGARSLLVEGGSSPAVSPNDEWLIYAVPVGRAWSLWAQNRRTGSKSQVVSASWFDDADGPVFSPDSGTIAFAAAGTGPEPSGWTPAAASLAKALRGTAHAHDLIGVAYDLWSVRPDGSNLRRVAEVFNVQPYLAWSPDGRHVAVWGGAGLQIVDVATSEWRILVAPAGGGPFSWGY